MDTPGFKYLEDIERYLDGVMSDEEHTAFEQRLKNEPELSREYDLIKILVRQVIQSGSIRNKTPYIEKKAYSSFLIYRIAASIILAIGLMSYYIYTIRASSAKKMVAQYWQKDNGQMILLGNERTTTMTKAIIAYKTCHYEDALREYKAIQQTDTAIFYEGLCEFQLGKDARPEMKRVTENNYSIYQARAKYYLMLLCILYDQKIQAKSLLKELEQVSDHPYKEQIMELSKEQYFKY
jgi:hypothetical protein